MELQSTYDQAYDAFGKRSPAQFGSLQNVSVQPSQQFCQKLCPQLSKPKVTVARNQNTWWQKKHKKKKKKTHKPSEKPSSVGWGGLFILWSDETSMVWSAFCSDSS